VDAASGQHVPHVLPLPERLTRPGSAGTAEESGPGAAQPRAAGARQNPGPGQPGAAGSGAEPGSGAGPGGMDTGRAPAGQV